MRSATVPAASGTAARARPRVGDLRADGGRRAARRDPAVRRPAARGGDLTIFHFALPSPMTDAFARLPRGRVLQYHNVTPGAFLRAVRPGVFRLAALGRAGARDARRADRRGARRLRVQPARARGARLRQHRRVPDRRRLRSDPARAAAAGARAGAVRRPAELPVRRPHRPEQEDRGPHPAGGALQALRRHGVPVHVRRQDRRHSALLRHGARAARRVSDAGRPFHLHRAGPGRGPGDVLPDARASTCRSRSTKGSACRCSRR